MLHPLYKRKKICLLIKDGRDGRRFTFQGRGCGLLEIYAIPTLQEKENLFVDQGWQKAVAWDMLRVYSELLKLKKDAGLKDWKHLTNLKNGI